MTMIDNDWDLLTLIDNALILIVHKFQPGINQYRDFDRWSTYLVLPWLRWRWGRSAEYVGTEPVAFFGHTSPATGRKSGLPASHYGFVSPLANSHMAKQSSDHYFSRNVWTPCRSRVTPKSIHCYFGTTRINPTKIRLDNSWWLRHRTASGFFLGCS